MVHRRGDFPVPRKDVMPLGVRERILSIRLMEKITANPAVAEKLGIVVVNEIQAVQERISNEKADNA